MLYVPHGKLNKELTRFGSAQAYFYTVSISEHASLLIVKDSTVKTKKQV